MSPPFRYAVMPQRLRPFNLRERITTLDSSVSAVGTSFASKKKALLQSKKTAANLDEAIDTLQACLRVLDLVNRVGDMIKEERYWSALKTTFAKALEDIESLPQSSLSQSPFFIHLLSSLPSLRAQIKDAVTASTKSWLLEIRNTSGQVGNLALEAMKTRTRRWKSKRDKEPLLKLSHVGSPVELVTNEKVEYNVLDNEQLQVDFKPLYQCIHIYTALDAIEELQRSYQADRKAQASLILSDRMSAASASRNFATTLLPLTEDVVGFFIIESHVLKTTRSFRSVREVEELWDSVVSKLIGVVQDGLKSEADVDTFLSCKDIILGFIQTLESLDQLLSKHVAENIASRLTTSRNVSQVAQTIINIEYFQAACTVLEEQLVKLRAFQRGGAIHLECNKTFSSVHARSVAHLTKVVNDKLNDSLEVAEYEWTPNQKETNPSLYLWDMINWLTTVVDGLLVRDEVKEEVYKGAVTHTAKGLMDFLVGPDVPVINENGIANLLVDVDFLEEEFKRLGKANLNTVFAELRATAAVALNDDVASYLNPTLRQARYSSVQPKRLASLLDKMARHGGSSRVRADQERGEKRRLEALAVARVHA
ncbi:hypothetical protein FRB99_007605 [Tulasnella sp. 403]|nr:hypothetical protein FRB99_007605 [Tulasnella sp. 403]